MTAAPIINDVITIVRTTARPIGKRFTINESGDLVKTATVSLTYGVAVQRAVPDATAMAAVLREVAMDPYAALLMAGYPCVPVGEEFLLLSEDEMRRATQVDADVPVELLLGPQEVTWTGGVQMIGVLWAKANAAASNWILLDRDIDEYTPEKFRGEYASWIGWTETLMPGWSSCAHVRVPSSSSRVLRNGAPTGAGNGHVWLHLADAGEVERLRDVVKLRAMQHGLSWAKPCRSADTGEVLRTLPGTTVLDYGVWVPGRAVFAGKPTVEGEGLSVIDPRIEVVDGPRLTTAGLGSDLTAAVVIELLTAAGISAKVTMGTDGRMRIDTHDLHFATVIEVKGEGRMTVAEALAAHPRGKVRVQSPFRASNSWAAFLSRADDGRPFVHDVGDGSTHWLAAEDWFTGARVVAQLAGMTPGQVRARWVDMVQGLPAGEVSDVIDAVVRITGQAKRVAQAELKEAMTRRKAEARRKAAAARQGTRTEIVVDPTRQTGMAAQVVELIAKHLDPEEALVFGGVLCKVVDDEEFPLAHLADDESSPAPLVRFHPLSEATALHPIEKVAAFVTMEPDGLGGLVPVPVGTPPMVVKLLREDPRGLPACAGLLVAPAVLPSGRILGEPGLDRASRLFLQSGQGLPGLRPYGHREARDAGRRLRQFLGEGFNFSGPLDEAVALAGLFGMLQRRLMSKAPGLAITAGTQSTGKTTLAARMVSVITGRPMPVMNLSLRASEELDKQLLAILVANPVAVVLDNLPDGSSFKSPAVAGLMTSPSFAGRLLGVSRIITVSTAVQWILTGNNLRLPPDEAQRFLECRLEANTASPHRRAFRHPDVFGHALAHRAQVLRDLAGIIAGWKQALDQGEVKRVEGDRFPEWSRYVRNPMLWAMPDLPDVGDAFTRSVEASEENWAATAIVNKLAEVFGIDRPFAAMDVVGKIQRIGGIEAELPDLREMLELLGGASDFSQQPENSVGKRLRALAGKWVTTGGDRELRITPMRTKTQRLWAIESAQVDPAS